MPFQVRFDYGAGGIFSPRWPPAQWIPRDESVGGSRKSATGVPAAYVVRREALLEIPLRIEEDEWVDLVNFLTFGQTAAAFTFYPDASDLGTSYAVYLETPKAGEAYAPEPTEFPRVLRSVITVRGVGSPPWPLYFV